MGTQPKHVHTTAAVARVRRPTAAHKLDPLKKTANPVVGKTKRPEVIPPRETGPF
jgi:hypothetical protein